MPTTQRWGHLLLALLAIGLIFGACLEDAAAQRTAEQDKDLATKEGVGQSLGQKDWEEDQLPGTFEIGMAVGSVIVAVAVWKWL